jgi:hypothetical protein
MIHLGAPDRIRTCDLRLRSPLLYPAELPGRTLDNYTSYRGGEQFPISEHIVAI